MGRTPCLIFISFVMNVPYSYAVRCTYKGLLSYLRHIIGHHVQLAIYLQINVIQLTLVRATDYNVDEVL